MRASATDQIAKAAATPSEVIGAVVQSTTPLEAASAPVGVWIDGRQQPLTSRARADDEHALLAHWSAGWLP